MIDVFASESAVDVFLVAVTTDLDEVEDFSIAVGAKHVKVSWGRYFLSDLVWWHGDPNTPTCPTQAETRKIKRIGLFFEDNEPIRSKV